MTDQINSTKNDLRINEISLDIIDHIQQKDIEFNNLSREINQILIFNMQYIHDDELKSLFIGAFFEAIKKYIIRMKKNDICMHEIRNTIEAIQGTMNLMFDKLKSDVLTTH